MKIKKYEITLTNPEAVHILPSGSERDVQVVYGALSVLWDTIDFEEWTLEISPYWEEVTDDA